MSDLSRIDSALPITFYATVYEQVTDPEMIKLSEKMKMPNLLRCSVPMPGVVDVVIRDPAAVEQILNWLRQHQKWGREDRRNPSGLGSRCRRPATAHGIYTHQRTCNACRRAQRRQHLRSARNIHRLAGNGGG